MAKKKIVNLDPEARSELKSTKNILDHSIEDLANTATIIGALRLQLDVANQEIEHLQELLKDSNVPDLERKSHEEEIIQVELKRLHQTHVINNIPLVDKDDIKKLEILVKSLATIRSGQVPKKKKEEKMSIADALDIMKDEVNG